MSKNESKLDQILELVVEASSEALEKRHKSSMKDYISTLKKSLGKAKDQATEQLKEKATAVDSHAHEKPWHYVACAAIGGLILGLWCRK